MSESDVFEQQVRVRSGDVDGDDFGTEWDVHYAVYATEDEDGVPCFDLWQDDGHGNGELVCAGYNRQKMVSLCLKLGDQVEWRAGVAMKVKGPNGTWVEGPVYQAPPVRRYGRAS